MTIYFLYNPPTNLFKIGKTDNVPRRMREWRREHPNIEISGFMPGYTHDEYYVHTLFADHRIGQNEWFRPCPEIRAYIEENTHRSIAKAMIADKTRHTGNSYIQQDIADYIEVSQPTISLWNNHPERLSAEMLERLEGWALERYSPEMVAWIEG